MENKSAVARGSGEGGVVDGIEAPPDTWQGWGSLHRRYVSLHADRATQSGAHTQKSVCRTTEL